MSEFLIDESKGPLLVQAVRSAPGYANQEELRAQARMIEAHDVSPAMRHYALGRVVGIVREYGSGDMATLLAERHGGGHLDEPSRN